MGRPDASQNRCCSRGIFSHPGIALMTDNCQLMTLLQAGPVRGGQDAVLLSYYADPISGPFAVFYRS